MPKPRNLTPPICSPPASRPICCPSPAKCVEAPKFDDTETTIEELRERIAKTIAFMDSVSADKIDGSEDKDITFPVGRDGATRTMKGEAYLKHWVFPNFFFHVTTAYALLRHNGVELGKTEYLLGARAGQ
jgi:uncharacterized protein